MTTRQLTRRVLAPALLAALTVVAPMSAQVAGNGDQLLREALHKQQVEGDLPGAIKIYQQIVAAPQRNRGVVARALLEMAGCYEKLGRQAESLYQQIVREFADQPAAVQARARLAALRPAAASSAMTLRRVEVGDSVQNIVASDGQRAVYWNGFPGTTLHFGDLAGKQKRVVLETPRAPRVAVTRDLSMVFLAFPPTDRPLTFATIKTDGTGYRELTLTENGKPLQFGNSLGPSCASWSWDSRYVVLCNAVGAGRLLKVSVIDGVVQDILPGQTTTGNRAEFSPNGRFVAFDRGFPNGVGVVPAQGGESRVLPSGVLVDWTRDGRHLLVAEQNTVPTTLSAVPISDGRPGNERIPLRSVPGAPFLTRTLLTGELLVPAVPGVPGAGRIVSLGVIGRDHKVAWTELKMVGNAIPNMIPAWSPDGQKFVYNSRQSDGTFVMRVRDTVTGEDRELYRHPAVNGCVWPRSRPFLWCSHIGVPGKTEVVAVSLDTGRAESAGWIEGNVILDHIRPDDKSIMSAGGTRPLWRLWEVGTEHYKPFDLYSSPDGRWEINEAGDGAHVLKIRPVGGGDGDWRLLAERRLPPPTQYLVPMRFSPDGNWFVYHDRDEQGRDSLYRVSTTGGVPERLGDYPTSVLSSMVSVSPDNRTFLVNAPAPRPRPEMWVLENFLRATAAESGAKERSSNQHSPINGGMPVCHSGAGATN